MSLGALALTVGFVSTALAVPPLPANPTPPERRAPVQPDARPDAPNRPATRGSNTGDAMRAAELMQRNNVTLEKVISAAESHAGGKAIEARLRSAVGSVPGSAPNSAPNSAPAANVGALIFDVTVLDRSGQLVTVNVDASNGTVTGTRAHSGDGRGLDGRDGMRFGAPGAIVKASDVVGRDVVDVTNREIGEIEEIAIDVGRSRIAYAIVELTDGPNQLLAVPWKSLRHNEGNCVLDLASDRKLTDAPRFDRNRWPDMSSGEFNRRITEFYGDQLVDQEQVNQAGRTLRIMKSGDIIGGDVRSTSDENLGDIHDLALDVNSNRVAYAVVSFGGFLGFGDKLFAIPIDAFTRDSNGRWVLAVSKERLKDAPGFDKKNWPNMADPTFDTQVRDFYRVHGSERVPSQP